MKIRWIVFGALLVMATICFGQKAKKETPKEPAKGKTDAAKDKAPVVIPPKVITGYRNGAWGMAQDKVMAKESRHLEIQQEPDYLKQLGLPDDVKALIPEDGKLPRRAPFRNFEIILDVDAAECKIVYYFHEDKLYMIFCREPLLRRVLKFKDWKDEMFERFGGGAAENDDGSMVWDQETTYCKAKPVFSSAGQHTDGTILETYTVFMYNKKSKKDILEWAKQNLKRSE